MPVCPKCGKLISDKKWIRHQSRCGKKRSKKEPLPIRDTTMWPPPSGHF